MTWMVYSYTFMKHLGLLEVFDLLKMLYPISHIPTEG